MAKYDVDEKLIDSYINGEVNDTSLVKYLEEDKHFMEKVMLKTKDVSYYDKCSNRIKTNTGFMRFLIKHFQANLDFLCNAVDYYFDNTKDEDNRMEIALLMTAITKKYDDHRHVKYGLMKHVLYSALRFQIEFLKNASEDDYEFKYETGLGFHQVMDRFKKNKIVLDYFAKKMLKEQFLDDYYALENILHEQYSSKEEIEKKGNYNCLLNIVRIYDEFLYAYLSVNKDLLSILFVRFERILKKWDKYVNIHEVLKYELVYDEVRKYFEEDKNIGFLTIPEILTLAGENLGILDKLLQYDIIEKCDIDQYLDDPHYFTEVLNKSFNDRLTYQNVKELLTNILFEQKIDRKQETANDGGEKIIELNNFRKKKAQGNS